jgi:hypothetical protein
MGLVVDAYSAGNTVRKIKPATQMNAQQATIGARVRSLRDFANVPEGTEGIVVEDYGTGVTVAWDLPSRPYPKHLTPEAVGKLWAIDPGCPLRDGFDKETELRFLEVVEEGPER